MDKRRTTSSDDEPHADLANIIAVFLNQSTAIDINPLLTRYRDAYGKHWPERLAKDFRQSGVLRQEHRQLARQLLSHFEADG